MSDFENDYLDYDRVRDNEGGEQSGRSEPSRGLWRTIVIVAGFLVVGGIILGLMSR